MNLEQSHGFRSCFNFVANGDYDVSDEFRRMLKQAGFEVGIHGLKHNEKLYASKSGFAVQAAEIRKYLQDWNVSGFRTPLMLHKLSWLHF
jgi:hypothetical protein